MSDSLVQSTQSIPDMGVRTTAAVIFVFAMVIFIVLLYIRMKDHDKAAGVD
jgi:hypothetical protein